MTYGVTDDGFVIKPFSDILSDLEDNQLENVNPGLTRDHLSVIGSINTGKAQQFSELWETAESSYANSWRSSASGVSLQYVAALTGTYLTLYSKTLVTATVTMNPYKSLPVGSVANLTGQADVRFLSLTEVPIDSAGGSFDVVFQAEDFGPIEVAIGQLNEISEAQTGWTAVTNAAIGIVGTEPETDSELRTKAELEIGASGSTNVDAIRARIIQNTTVTSCQVLENDTDLADTNLLPPHSIHVITLGGVSQDISEEIFLAKAATVRTYGSISDTVTDTQENDHTILHDTATEIDIDMNFIFLVEDGYTASTVIAVVTANLTAYVTALNIGEDVIYYDALCVANGTDGVDKLLIFAVEGGTADIEIDSREKAVPDSIGWGS